MPKRALAVVRPRRSSFACTTAGGGSSGWSSDNASKWPSPGSYGGAACAAASGSPTTHPFALPGKRFAKAPVLEKSSEYLGTDQSYARITKHQGMAITYDGRTPPGKEPWISLAPGTVWRWLSWLGGMTGTLRTAWKLIREKEPNSTLHREPWAVSPKRYRSEKRRDTLQQAMQLLAADRLCQSLFGVGIFPRYATGRSGP
jgi:hypothetical protein